MVALIETNAVSTSHTPRIAGDESLGWDIPAAAAPAAPARTRRPKGRPARRQRAARQWRPNFDNDDTLDPTQWAELKAILTRPAEGVVGHHLDKLCPMLERVAIADPVFCARFAAIYGGPVFPDSPVMIMAIAMHAYATADTTTRHRMFANYNAWFKEQNRAENP